MDIEWLRKLCLSLPAVSEDVKWGNDLCFMVAGKMFCVAWLGQPTTISFKVKDDEFEELSQTDGFIPAPYMARAKWVQVKEATKPSRKEWEHYIRQSYELVKARLPKKIREQLTSG